MQKMGDEDGDRGAEKSGRRKENTGMSGTEQGSPECILREEEKYDSEKDEGVPRLGGGVKEEL